LAQEFCLLHLSTGEIFRQAVRSESPLGRQAQEYVARGELVPDALVEAVVEGYLDSLPDKVGFILDGFPRTRPQAEALDRLLSRRASTLDAVVLFEASDETLQARLVGRRWCASCGAFYHLVTAPPRVAERCDQCGGRLSVRDDDQPAAIERRLRIYRETERALTDYYSGRGCLGRLSAEGSVEEIYARLREWLLANVRCASSRLESAQ